MSPAIATKPVIFTSKFPNYRLVRIQEDVLRAEGGRKFGAIAPGSKHNERYGVEDDGAPWAVEFEGGAFETDNPILIEWLRGHDKFNSPDGFYEQDPAPVELEPTVVTQLARIARASASQDAQDLADLLEEEEATHNRAQVMEVAADALRTLGEMAAQAEADANPDNNGDSSSTSPPSPPA